MFRRLSKFVSLSRIARNSQIEVGISAGKVILSKSPEWIAALPSSDRDEIHATPSPYFADMLSAGIDSADRVQRSCDGGLPLLGWAF